MPAGTTTWSATMVAFASWIAARSVHSPTAVAQTPSPGAASGPSAVVFTRCDAASALDTLIRTVSTTARRTASPPTAA